MPAFSLPFNSKCSFVVVACLLTTLVTIAYLSDVETLVAPFSATCVLLVLLPKSPFSQPKTIVLSHIICIGIGTTLVLLPLAFHTLALMLLATWISTVLMATFRVVHAPAVAHAAILSLGQQNLARYVFWAMVTVLIFAAYAYMVSRVDKSTANPATPAM